MRSDRVQIIEVADLHTVVNDALCDRAVRSSRGHYTKHFVVSDQGGEVAFLSLDPRLDPNLLVIYEIFVVPEIRRRGVGTRYFSPPDSGFAEWQKEL
jgi:Acetyltransferase (GNAT) family